MHSSRPNSPDEIVDRIDGLLDRVDGESNESDGLLEEVIRELQAVLAAESISLFSISPERRERLAGADLDPNSLPPPQPGLVHHRTSEQFAGCDVCQRVGNDSWIYLRTIVPRNRIDSDGLNDVLLAVTESLANYERGRRLRSLGNRRRPA